MSESRSESYKAAGVDVVAGYESVKLIKPMVESTFIPGVIGSLGGFGGLFQPNLSGMSEPVLVSGTDGDVYKRQAVSCILFFGQTIYFPTGRVFFMKKVCIVMGSDSDLKVMSKCADKLKDFGIPFDVRVISAHRTPAAAEQLAKNAAADGFGVIIAAAGKAARCV